jgi:Salmonella virulence plasmid 65kDa B protein
MIDQRKEKGARTTVAEGRREDTDRQGAQSARTSQFSAPSISLPKGGGAIRGIGEKFAANPVTGTGSMTVPIAATPGRSGLGPQLALSYDPGSGNGPFGLFWNLSQYLTVPTRKEDLARKMAEDEGIIRGLVRIFSLLEPCRTFSFKFEKGRPFFQSARRKRLFIYFYFMDREFWLICPGRGAGRGSADIGHQAYLYSHTA